VIEKKNLFEEYEKVISKVAILKNKVHLSHLDQKEIKTLNQKKKQLKTNILVSGAEEIVGYISIKNKKITKDEENFNQIPSKDGEYGIIRIS
jgi:hypothetical protein